MTSRTRVHQWFGRMAFACAFIFAMALHAQSTGPYQIKAYRSNGTVIGCLTTPTPITTPQSLKPCIKSPGQLFLFNTSTGGQIQQKSGTSNVCLVMLATTITPVALGRRISRVDCNNIPEGSLPSWKWTPQTTLIQLQGTSYCMTFDTGNNFVLGDCGMPKR